MDGSDARQIRFRSRHYAWPCDPCGDRSRAWRGPGGFPAYRRCPAHQSQTVGRRGTLDARLTRLAAGSAMTGHGNCRTARGWGSLLITVLSILAVTPAGAHHQGSNDGPIRGVAIPAISHGEM